MRLLELLEDIEIIDTKGNIDIEIDDISHNNNEGSNLLHFCYKGVNTDGHKYYKEAIDKGAVALVVEYFVDSDIPQVRVENVRQTMGLVCRAYFNNPIKNIRVIGITGTNGKTSTSIIAGKVIGKSLGKTGVIGTNGYYIDGVRYESSLTTPDPYDLWAIFDNMNRQDVKYVIMEVSAHAIALDKIAGIKFDLGVLTNISQDHLDFFQDMTEYANTKKYFLQSCSRALINIDDHYASSWHKFIDYSLGYGTSDCNFKIMGSRTSINGTTIRLKWGKIFRFRSNLIGQFNVYNLTASIAICLLLGCSYRDICSGIKDIEIDGRFNILPVRSHVIVDYAHTPDGMEKVLSTARDICRGKVITVFGCGGNRDKSKRPIMGSIASKLSDYVILTSDNPRFESPKNIIKSIEDGIINKRYMKVVENRAEAIREALNMAGRHDLVMILGKGAEDYQDVRGEKRHFSDTEEVMNYFQKG